MATVRIMIDSNIKEYPIGNGFSINIKTKHKMSTEHDVWLTHDIRVESGEVMTIEVVR